MKKILSLILVLVMCLSMCACEDNTAKLEEKVAVLEQQIADLQSESKSDDQHPAEYVGEWRQPSSSALISASATMQLKGDGTGSLTCDLSNLLDSYTADLTWRYNKKYNTIEVEVPLFNSTGSFLVYEDEGETLLVETGKIFTSGSAFGRVADLEE